MTSTLHISATDLERAITAGLAAKVGPKATASVSFGNDRIDVKVAGISKTFGIGPISKTFDLGGTIHVRSVPSPVVGCVALEWGMASFPETIRPMVSGVIDFPHERRSAEARDRPRTFAVATARPRSGQTGHRARTARTLVQRDVAEDPG